MRQDLVDLIPTIASPVEATVDIDHLVVRDDGEFWGGSEPYLMLTFFKIDGDTAIIEGTIDVSGVLSGEIALKAEMRPGPGQDSIVQITKRGGHGSAPEVNIGPIELAAGGPKTVNIPSNTGQFARELKPIPIRLLLDTGDLLVGLDLDGLPGFIGVHVVLAEEDFTPSNAIDAAHSVVADGIREILEDVLKELDLSDLSVKPENFVVRQALIEDAAQSAAANEMNAWELFWGGVVDPDDQLINAFHIANVLELSNPKSIEHRYKAEHGDWILVGEIR